MKWIAITLPTGPDRRQRRGEQRLGRLVAQDRDPDGERRAMKPIPWARPKKNVACSSPGASQTTSRPANRPARRMRPRFTHGERAGPVTRTRSRERLPLESRTGSRRRRLIARAIGAANARAAVERQSSADAVVRPWTSLLGRHRSRAASAAARRRRAAVGAACSRAQRAAAFRRARCFVTSEPRDSRPAAGGRAGTARSSSSTTARSSTFLELPPGSLGTGGERGLFSVALAPDYASNGRLYVVLHPAGRRRADSSGTFRSTSSRHRATGRARAPDGRCSRSTNPSAQPQRRPAAVRPRRLPLHRHRRRRRPRRSRERPGRSSRCSASSCASTRGRARPGLRTRCRPATRSPGRRRPPTRSGATACETRGASPSTGVTGAPADRRRRPGRLGGGRLRARRPRAGAASTSAGTAARAARLRAPSRAPAARDATPTRSRVREPVPVAPRSPAATSSATRASPTSTAATCSPTSARARSARSIPGAARRARRRPIEPARVGTPGSFGEDSCGRLYVASLAGLCRGSPGRDRLLHRPAAGDAGAPPYPSRTARCGGAEPRSGRRVRYDRWHPGPRRRSAAPPAATSSAAAAARPDLRPARRRHARRPRRRQAPRRAVAAIAAAAARARPLRGC